ncbi:MAG: endonuclease/exonuclease/phosphatase family protein, partial [Candidatus Roizmanbacteria bacterium]|nr:endonuclease/exonuclease/phosphatase family protein [Candidatus Roizmanbacteria bacterium]
IDEIINKYHPDIVCLQEVLTEDKNIKKIEKLGYKLADFANSFIKFGKIFGVITFYNPKTLIFNDSFTLNLGINPIEYFFYLLQVILGYNKPKTILKTDFIHKSTRKKLSICNVHLYVIGSNELRIKHINQALKSINLLKNHQLIICGDFNYFPYLRKRLERMMARYHLKEATKNIGQTIKFSHDGLSEKFSFFERFFSRFINKVFADGLKIDYIFYRGLRLKKTERIEMRYSDHYPIISTFKI